MKEKFDDRSIYWKPDDIDYNLWFLRMNEHYLNEKLRTEHHVSIFEVYYQLGLPLDNNRLLRSITDPDEVQWAYGKDIMIDFGAKENKDTGIIELDFNID